MLKRLLDNLVPPSSGERFPALDGLRGLAVLMVLFGHAVARLPSMMLTGVAAALIGVCIFFCLSGFLLFHPYAAGRALDLRAYYRRRFWRIYPAWLVALPLGFVASLMLRQTVTLTGTLAHLLFAHTLSPMWRLQILPPGWSMGPEVQFYIALPLLVLVSQGRRWLPLAGAAACAALQFRAPLGSIWWSNWPLLGLPFFCGMMASYIVHHGRAHRLTAFAGFIALAAVCIYLKHHAKPMGFDASNTTGLMIMLLGPRGLLASFAVATVLIGLTRPGDILHRVFASPPMRALGVCGYSIFLLHYPVFAVVRTLSASPMADLVGFLLALVIGRWSYLNIELPFLTLGRGRSARPPEALNPASAQSQSNTQLAAGSPSSHSRATSSDR